MRYPVVAKSALLLGMMATGRAQDLTLPTKTEVLVDVTRHPPPAGFEFPKHLPSAGAEQPCIPPAAGLFHYILVVSSEGRVTDAHPMEKKSAKTNACVTAIVTGQLYAPASLKGKLVAVRFLYDFQIAKK